MSDDRRAAAVEARRRAVRGATHVKQKPNAKKSVQIKETAAADEIVADVEDKGKLLDLQSRVISVLREIAGMEFAQIDKLLALPSGSSKRIATKAQGGYERHTQRHIDACVSRFYRNKITILEHLIHAAPASIKMWSDDLKSKTATTSRKGQAAREIREWTALFLRTKQSSAVRDLFSADLKEAAEEADEMESMLQGMLGDALEGTEAN